MVFSSLLFLLWFLPLFFVCYFLSPHRFKNFILLVFSIIFYAWGEPKYISLLLISSVVDYINGRCLEKCEGRRNRQKIFLVISIVVNLSLLGIFKYMTLFITTINGVFGAGIKEPKLALPLGISFFTFQTMSYSIDVYRGKIKPEHNFINYMAYVSMFPQLVAGPIVRYEEIMIQLKSKRRFNLENFENGAERFLFGLFKKVLVANQVGSLWDKVLEMGDRSVLMAWLGLVAFTFRIYFDFSGYSDMAVGMGRIMGFSYPENFNYPYISKSITEFWRRWHMTLSGWFRDYVYIPLGGNRKGKGRQILNIAIVWALTGFWHGASWNYLLWGLYFGVILTVEKLATGGLLMKAPALVSRIYSLILIMLGWMIFAVEDIKELGTYAVQTFGFKATCFVDKAFLFQLRNYAAILVVATIFSTPIYPAIIKKIEGSESAGVKNLFALVKMTVMCLLVTVCISMLVADSYNPFLYFRF